MTIEPKIIIKDNFLNTIELQEINKTLLNPNWSIQKSFHTSKNEFLMKDVSNVYFYETHLFEKIQKEFNLDTQLKRVYFNGQWPKMDGDLHTDGCFKTALIYISTYKFGWGGFTEFVDGDEHFVIPPIQNRIAIFPGDILHKGYSYTDSNCPMRISLAFKLL